MPPAGREVDPDCHNMPVRRGNGPSTRSRPRDEEVRDTLVEPHPVDHFIQKVNTVRVPGAPTTWRTPTPEPRWWLWLRHYGACTKLCPINGMGS